MDIRLFDRLIAWVREEVRLIGLESWADGAYHADSARPCTRDDPRCARTLERQAEVARDMARLKRRMLDGRRVSSAAATDVRQTIMAARRAVEPAVQLVKIRKS